MLQRAYEFLVDLLHSYFYGIGWILFWFFARLIVARVLGKKGDIMLEGNEVEKSYDGGAGKLIIDVNDKGGVKLANEYVKDLDGFAKVKSITELETDIFMIAEKITKKTGTEWDDKLLAGLKSLLGITA